MWIPGRKLARRARGETALVITGLLAACALALGSGCSAKKGGGENRLASVEGFCDQWASRACSDSVVTACASASADSCRNAQRSFCESLVPESEYSPKTAEACLSAVESAYKDAALTADERDVVQHLGGACDKILSGTVEAGGHCKENKDCNRDDDLDCVMRQGVGTCAVPVEVKAGHSCAAPGSVCETGFYCKDGDICATLDIDATCSLDKPCGVDSRCKLDDPSSSVDGGAADSGAGGSGTGTCVALLSNGSSCTSDDECQSRICLGLANGKKSCADKITLSRSEPICADLQ